MPSPPGTRPPLWRRWRVVLAALAAIALLIVGGLHLPFARARVLSWVSAELGKRGIRFDANRLSYNLFSLTVGLDRVVVAATGGGPPVFEADAVRLNFPFAALRGALRVQSIEIDRPRLRVIRHADGSWNLPASASAGDDGPLLSGPLELDHVVIRNMEVEYTDAIQRVAVVSRGMSLDLHRVPGRPLTGRLAMGEPASVRQGDRATSVSTLKGQLSFDGETVSIGALDVAALEGRTRIAGTIGPFTAEPQLRLDVDAALDVSRVVTWFAVPSPPTGHVAVKASLNGPFDAPRAEIQTTSPDFVWPAIGALPIEIRATIAEGAAEITSLRVGLAGGDVDATGRVAFAGEERSEANIRWQRLDAGAIARIGAALPIRPAALADGELTLSWTGQDLLGARARLRTSLREPPAASRGLPVSGRLEASVADRRGTLTVDSLVARSIAVAGTVGGRLDDNLAASTLDGQTTVRVANVETALLGLKGAGVDLGAVPISGSVNAAIDLDGTIGAPRAAGTLEATSGPNAITANASIDFKTQALAGQFDARLAQLSALGATLPEAWRPDGTGRITGQFGGTLTRPVVDLNVAADNVRIAGQSIARLSATGQYSFDQRRYSINATGTALAIDHGPLRALGEVRLSGAGVIDRPEAAGTV
jgi:hypothetical protein